VLDPESFYGIRARLVHANYRGPRNVFWYYILRALLAVVFLPIGYYAAMLIKDTGATPWIGAAALGLFGAALPPLWVNDRVARRREAIRAAVPNVLDLIIVCVEAGLSLNAAIQRIASDMKRTYPDLSWELMILNQEIFIGKSRVEAFRNLARRTGVDELRALATVLMQSDRMGTGIADVLRVQAETLRSKRRQAALEAAHKMPVKLVFPLVLCIFPEMLVVLLSPGVIQLYRSLTESVP
jgi:tight adherence protein C